MLRKGKLFPHHMCHPLCYFCYNPSDSPCMRKGPNLITTSGAYPRSFVRHSYPVSICSLNAAMYKRKAHKVKIEIISFVVMFQRPPLSFSRRMLRQEARHTNLLYPLFQAQWNRFDQQNQQD